MTQLDKSLGEIYHASPFFFRMDVISSISGGKRRENRASMSVRDSKERTRLMSAGPGNESGGIPSYAAPGFILYAFQPERTLMARPFDLASLKFTGEAVAIAENVPSFSISDRGSLVYFAATNGREGRQQLVWIDRSGKPEEPFGEPAAIASIRLAPDGNTSH